MSGSLGGTLSMDDSDIGKLISSLDLMKEDVRGAVADGLRAGAEIIAAEQRRLAGEISSKLPPAISVGKIETTKKGRLRIASGYLHFNGSDNKDPAVIGSVFEYGRPGKSKAHSDPKRYWHYTRNGKTIIMVQEKGTIQPRPHIRRGFDNKKDEACRALESRVNSVIK